MAHQAPASPQKTAPVAVFWDYENLPIPRDIGEAEAVSRLRKMAIGYGHLAVLKAYLDTSLQGTNTKIRSAMQCSGVSIIDTPHNGSKEVADKMLIVDIMTFALDQKAPATIILISSDRDFAYLLATLRNRCYNVVIFTNHHQSTSLRAQADEIKEWRTDVLNLPLHAPKLQHAIKKPKPYNQDKRTAGAAGHDDRLPPPKRHANAPNQSFALPPVPYQPYQPSHSYKPSPSFNIPHQTSGLPVFSSLTSKATYTAATATGTIWAHSKGGGKNGESWTSRPVQQPQPQPQAGPSGANVKKAPIEVIEISDDDEDRASETERQQAKQAKAAKKFARRLKSDRLANETSKGKGKRVEKPDSAVEDGDLEDADEVEELEKEEHESGTAGDAENSDMDCAATSPPTSKSPSPRIAQKFSGATLWLDDDDEEEEEDGGSEDDEQVKGILVVSSTTAEFAIAFATHGSKTS
ncbi:hypothetical protein RQP46_010336 [Phenoliferia psychrophenolica]